MDGFSGRMTFIRSVLELAAMTAVIVLSGTMIWFMFAQRGIGSLRTAAATPRTLPAATLPKEPVSLDNAEVEGHPGAKVAIIEYADFQCPYCGRFATTTLPLIRQRYVDSGRVLVAFRHLPLQQIHPFAVGASEAAECAATQGRFWTMHDYLFAHQDALKVDDLRMAARALGLNTSSFNTCLDAHDDARIRKSVASASALGIAGTPTFLIGSVTSDGRVSVKLRLAGAMGIEQFQSSIASVLESGASGTSRN